jgi:dTDP-glucose 4,6-dehydratase
MPKVVVLGSNAFAGQDFVDLLLDDPANEVIAVSRREEKPAFLLRYRDRPDLSRFRFVKFDMNGDSEALCAFLDRERPQEIVNFAAQSEVAPSWDHPEQWFETNTVALAKLVNHLRRRDYLQKYLHISSPEAYGASFGEVVESTPDNPSTPYAASKAAADMLLEVYRKQYGFPVVTIRSTNTYGARQQLFKIIMRTAIYVRLRRRIQLHGGGVAVKSYIHVRDVSHGELAALREGTAGERFHLCPDRGIAVRDIVRLICERSGADFEQATEMVEERPGQDAAYVIDSSLARRRFGWRPEISIEQGLDEVTGWIDRHWDQILEQPLEYIHLP